MRFGDIHGLEAQAVPRSQLADLPAICGDHHEGADETAQRGAIGAEDDRHVAGEIDRTDGIGIVMDIGRMKPRLAAILARPFGLGPDQPDAGAIAVVMHLPFGSGDRLHVVRGEEVGRAVRAV